MVDADTRAIVQDYIQYRLRENNIVWDNGRQNVSPNEIETAMRALGDEFEEKFKNRFTDMFRQLDFTEENARDTFFAIVEEIFQDGVSNWGRIVALFGFAGKFAIQCYNKNMSHMIGNITDWVSMYVDNNLRDWMLTHNKWRGFLEFYAGGPDSRKEMNWPSFKTLFGYAAAGLGVLTLGVLLSHKS